MNVHQRALEPSGEPQIGHSVHWNEVCTRRLRDFPGQLDRATGFR